MQNRNQNSVWHIDRMVITVFVTLIIVSSAIFGFKIYNYEPCPIVGFEVQEYNLRVGEDIHFYNNTVGDHTLEWDFGDSTEVSWATDPVHIYSKPGEYMVKLTANGQCFDYKTVVIQNPVPVIDRTLIPSFVAPREVRVGQKVRFNDLTDGANVWEWRFGETGNVDSKAKNPVYEFTQVGKAKVSLIVNGDARYIAEKVVRVLPKARKKKTTRSKPKKELYIPESPEEYKTYEEEEIAIEIDEPTTSFITDDNLILLIKDVAEERQKQSVVKPYFCLGMENSLIKANGELMKLKDFLEKVKGKELKVRSFYSFRDKDNNQCVVRIEIKYKTKVF